MSRITPGTILLAFVAIMFGLVGTYVLRQALKPATTEAAAADPDTVTVPMASTNLEAGRELTLGDIALVRMKRREIRERGIRQYMTNAQQIIGRVTRIDVTRGSTFDTTMFYPEGLGPSIEDRLAAGRRAITISVAADGAVLGFARAGSLVDVLFRSETADDRPEKTVTLVEMAEVLALGQETFAGTRRNDTTLDRNLGVTLSVTPGQAAALRIAAGRGTLSLMIRNPHDPELNSYDTEHRPAPATLEEIMNWPDRSNLIEVYRGTSLRAIRFDREGRRISRSTGYRSSQNISPQLEPGKARTRVVAEPLPTPNRS